MQMYTAYSKTFFSDAQCRTFTQMFKIQSKKYSHR